MTRITLLDGSIGQEVVRRAGDKPTALWSTQAMIDHPGIVGEVHGDYSAAGATIATTNTYAIHRDRLARYLDETQFEPLVRAALKEAKLARDAAGGGRIAGSVGPLGASYRPDICPPPHEAAPLIAELAGLLEPEVDLLICETVSSVTQAEGALLGCADIARPVWLAVTVMDDDGTRLRSGEPVGDLLGVVEKYQPDAVLANCSTPEVMADALRIISGFGKPFGAYANGFKKISDGFLKDSPTVDALEARTDLGPAEYADFVLSWVGLGATIIGGCCETGPAHIAEIARRLIEAGHEIG